MLLFEVPAAKGMLRSMARADDILALGEALLSAVGQAETGGVLWFVLLQPSDSTGERRTLRDGRSSRRNRMTCVTRARARSALFLPRRSFATVATSSCVTCCIFLVLSV